MIILGISPLDKDATASLVVDGKVVFASGEERYTRIKQQDGFPRHAIEAALKFAGLTMADVDVVAYPFLTKEQEAHCIRKNLEAVESLGQIPATELPSTKLNTSRNEVPGLSDPNEMMKKPIHHNMYYETVGKPGMPAHAYSKKAFKKWAEKAIRGFEKSDDELAEGLASLGYTGEVKRVDHHRSHAANAFYGSEFDEALIVTMDGYGTGQAASVSVGNADGIKLLHKTEYPHSLGLFYEQVTSALGFKPSRHEGKIVGLAAYGDPKKLGPYLLSRMKFGEGTFSFDMPHNEYFARFLASRYPKIDVAAGFQWALEQIVCKYIKHYVDQTGLKNVVLSGGVIANVKMNQRIYEIEGVESIYVYPNMGDGGCATGAAMLVAHAAGERIQFTDPYLGEEFSDEEMQAALDAEGLEYEELNFAPSAIARLINDGKVVARFNGRMEYGPRALGNRSILYHGKDVGVNNWLNHRLGRTEFMPFAPVVLMEDADRYFHNTQGVEHTAQFMTVTLDCKPPMLEDCPAAVHVDNTARPQLITKERNPEYYDILRAYHTLSGSSSLINTSFNMHEEPIVRTPQDAIRAYQDGKLDALSMGRFLVVRDKKHTTQEEAPKAVEA